MKSITHIQENMIAAHEKTVGFGMKAVEASLTAGFDNLRTISGISKPEDMKTASANIVDNCRKFGDDLKNIHTAWMGSLSKQ